MYDLGAGAANFAESRHLGAKLSSNVNESMFSHDLKEAKLSSRDQVGC